MFVSVVNVSNIGLIVRLCDKPVFIGSSRLTTNHWLIDGSFRKIYKYGCLEGTPLKFACNDAMYLFELFYIHIIESHLLLILQTIVAYVSL